MLNDELKLS